MSRETKEQKEARWAEEERVSLIKKEEFRKSMPERLMQLQAEASACGVNTRVELTVTGPSVEFSRYQYDDRGSNFEETLTYDSEEWHVGNVSRMLKAFKEQIDARARRKFIAETVWNNLTDSEKICIKEFINYLT